MRESYNSKLPRNQWDDVSSSPSVPCVCSTYARDDIYTEREQPLALQDSADANKIQVQPPRDEQPQMSFERAGLTVLQHELRYPSVAGDVSQKMDISAELADAAPSLSACFEKQASSTAWVSVGKRVAGFEVLAC